MAEQENTVPDYPRGITFEQVWAAIMAGRKDFEETSRVVEETSREVEETSRMVKELSIQMGGLHRSFGELAEHLVAPGIVSRFNEMGYHFDSVAPQGIEIYDESR
jgi:hypothetical protein